MITSSRAVRREHVRETYVCLSCRLSPGSRNTTNQGANRVREAGHVAKASGSHQQERSARRTGTAVTNEDDHASNRVAPDRQGQSITSTRPRQRSRASNASSTALSASRSVPWPLSSTSLQRAYHASRRWRQQAAAAMVEESYPPPSMPDPSQQVGTNTGGIRDQLRQWHELHGKQLDAEYKEVEYTNDEDGDDTANNLTRLPDPSSTLRNQAQQVEAEEEAIAHYSRTPEDDGTPIDKSFLRPGDLVELDFPKSERESVIAVFVRRHMAGALLFSMQGRWIFQRETAIQYSIPGWISPKLIEPILPYLPEVETNQDMEDLLARAYMEDLSVPRSAAAPLVTRMVQFHAESQEIYRKHAGALDNAHATLAHDTDLRYGSLVSAATTLLKIPASELPVTALFTVRKALINAGFAFNVDRRSHRLTGYLQIRSKDQIRMVDTVRQWLRDWQDDMAIQAAMEGDDRALRRHKPKKGAEATYSFLKKVRAIVLESRKDRQPTVCGNVGPSKQRYPISPSSEAMRSKTETQFDDNDMELIRFIEAWACSAMFLGLPRIEALPPLLLQATGLYPDHELRATTGFLLLQEIGTIMPYENRVRFDQHLLLPSSQHSKPLQILMSSLMKMAGNKHDFQDSMASLRHDFGDLPVYCIDSASAHEIDDGLSVEGAGEGQWWVHIHIANPTAFFSRDHPLSKMARHMGESIYMPERVYMMLPRWATQKHFSLAKERPSMTFSVKLDEEGRTLEHMIRPGHLRKVVRLTYDELAGFLKTEKGTKQEMKTVTVGGDPQQRAYAPKNPTSIVSKTQMEKDLKALAHLSQKRSERRGDAGGVFFDLHKPEVEVFANHIGPGLAWDHPYRKGSRTTLGDPVVQLTTKGFQNWFASSEGSDSILVPEMMLLACETAAKWCDERRIPTIFRGTASKPDQPDGETYRREVLAPAAAKDPNGEYPMHLGARYIDMLGTTILSTTSLPHKTLGLSHYGKVTSPLRRYGDMILHWQIEAALREEARLGESLETTESKPDRSFLPFSANVLETIMLGLRPREKIIQRAQAYSDQHWIAQLLFRAFHFGETELPLAPYNDASYEALFEHLPGYTMKVLPPTPPRMYKCKVFLSGKTVFSQGPTIGCQNMELNTATSMWKPENLGMEPAQAGDVWECAVMWVDCYWRVLFVKPLRLLERAEE